MCEEQWASAGARVEAGWRVLALVGPFPFDLVGVLASVTSPLASAGVSVFAISTFDTDYVLVKEEHLARAVAVLRSAGHEVKEESEVGPA